MMSSKNRESQIPQDIKEAIIRVLKAHGAARISIFGSYARGEAGPESDIDILVRFGRPRSLIQLVTIEDELRLALHRNVDLLTEKAVSPYLRDVVLRDEVVILE
jgi:hypothetical protein